MSVDFSVLHKTVGASDIDPNPQRTLVNTAVTEGIPSLVLTGPALHATDYLDQVCPGTYISDEAGVGERQSELVSS